jgi:hypothetical protein
VARARRPNAGDAGFDAGVLVPDPADFDKSRVTRFGLMVGKSPDYAGPPATLVVLVDTVSFEDVAGAPPAEKTFDESRGADPRSHCEHAGRGDHPSSGRLTAASGPGPRAIALSSSALSMISPTRP